MHRGWFGRRQTAPDHRSSGFDCGSISCPLHKRSGRFFRKTSAMSDRVEPLAKCVALFPARLCLVRFPTNRPLLLRMQPRYAPIGFKVCQQLERMLERCDQEAILMKTPFWARSGPCNGRILTLVLHAAQRLRRLQPPTLHGPSLSGCPALLGWSRGRATYCRLRAPSPVGLSPIATGRVRFHYLAASTAS